MTIMKCIVFIAVLAIVFSTSNAAFFRLIDHQPICFAEEIGHRSEVVVVEYVRKRSQAVDDVPVKVIVTSPVAKQHVFNGHVRLGQNTFSFKPLATERSGEYDICFSSVSPLLDGTGNFHVEVSILVDHHDRKIVIPKPSAALTRQKVHEEEVFTFIDADGQPKDTLRTHDYIERVTSLLNQIAASTEEARGEVKYFEERTDRMRVTTESTFNRVWGCSAITIGVLTVISWVQYAFLKSFLKRKKLV